MRVSIFLAAAFIAFGATPVSAQVEMTVPEAGRVKTTAKVENGILGISNSFPIPRDNTRMRGSLLLRDSHKNQGLDMPRF
jgi:hypothetical protein